MGEETLVVLPAGTTAAALVGVRVTQEASPRVVVVEGRPGRLPHGAHATAPVTSRPR